jgi:hypothetical protein
MTLARLLAGVCALLFGRQLFWLFVGAVGFALGIDVATRLFAGSSTFVILTAALLIGVAGAILARATQEFMIGIVGFLVGGYLGAQLLTAVMPYPGRDLWFAVFGGGIAGVLLLNALFDWALIVMSSLVGAAFIVDASGVSGHSTPFLYAALAMIGIVIQAIARRQRRPRPRI